MTEESSVLDKRLKAERPTRLICTTLLLRLLSVDGGQSFVVIAQRVRSMERWLKELAVVGEGS